MNNQKPNDQKKPQVQRPVPNGTRPAGSNLKRPTPNVRVNKNPQRPPQKSTKEPAPQPRRRNEESYVFSRSLSETQERILTERRERLADAKKFRRGNEIGIRQRKTARTPC